MLSRIAAPYASCDMKDLYLLDTNIVYRMCSMGNRHKTVWGIQKYQDRIAEAVMSGYAVGGVVTDIVVGEMDRISREKRRQEAFFVGNVERIVNDPKIRLGHFSMDYMGDVDRSAMFSYLRNNIRTRTSRPGYDEGEVSLLMAAYETGIRTLVTDDNDVFKDSIKNYMKNKMRDRFGLRNESNFRTVSSKDFCREIGV